MTYRIKRILFKDGTLLTERNLTEEETVFASEAPAVGDIVSFTLRGRQLRVEVIWGNWTGREPPPPDFVVPLRVKEV